MRNIIIISAACELALLAAAILAGAPVASLMRGAVRRGANAAVLCCLALASWIAAGVTIGAVTGALPEGGRFGAGMLTIGGVDFNLVIFVPMMSVSVAIAFLLSLALVAAGRGLGLGECLRAARRLSVR